MELEIWVLRKNYKTLANEKFSISLTKTELLILEALAKKKDRAEGSDLLIYLMNKDPKTYKGLPMCISRLRKKFKKKTNGENIFIAIRNHGYYLKPLIAISN